MKVFEKKLVINMFIREQIVQANNEKKKAT